MTVLKAKEITHVFERPTIDVQSSERRINALNMISFSVQSGTLVLILGPSGSGKSTLFHILATYLVPTAGAVVIEDYEPLAKPPDILQKFRWEKIGYLQQKLVKNFIPHLTLSENIDFILAIKGTISEQNELQIKHYLNKLGLEERHFHIPLKNLSGGEQQRASLLLLLLKNPEIFLLDEPTSFLDEENKIRVLMLLEELQQSGKMLIIATHDELFVKSASMIFYLEDGKIKTDHILTSLASTLKNLPTFLGTLPTQNFFLIIPDPIYQNLPKEIVYSFQLLTNDRTGFFLSPLDHETFLAHEYEKWFFLTDNLINIPLEFRTYPWLTKRFSWEISPLGIEIVFEDNSSEVEE